MSVSKIQSAWRARAGACVYTRARASRPEPKESDIGVRALALVVAPQHLNIHRYSFASPASTSRKWNSKLVNQINPFGICKFLHYGLLRPTEC